MTDNLRAGTLLLFSCISGCRLMPATALSHMLAPMLCCPACCNGNRRRGHIPSVSEVLLGCTGEGLRSTAVKMPPAVSGLMRRAGLQVDGVVAVVDADAALEQLESGVAVQQVCAAAR
jgi:hypothetical protein